MGKILPQKIEEVKKQMYDFADAVISGKWKGHTGKGNYTNSKYWNWWFGSGTRYGDRNAKFYNNHLQVTFVSNVEGDHVEEESKRLILKRHFL